MDKIKGLLQKIGASEELAKSICEELERYDKQIQEKFEGVYKGKLDQAKKVCVEEVQKYKVELARKVRIFLEGKSNQIEKRLDQQRAIEEGEAKALLRQVKQVTENIEVADDADLKALKEQIQKLEEKNVTLTEEKKKAITAANRANKIALEVIERNKKPVVSEEVKPSAEARPAPAPVVSEEAKKAQAKKIEEQKRAAEAKKIEEQKKLEARQKTLKEEAAKAKTQQAQPKTTRRPLAESIQPAKKPVDTMTGLPADTDILSIAKTIE